MSVWPGTHRNNSQIFVAVRQYAGDCITVAHTNVCKTLWSKITSLASDLYCSYNLIHHKDKKQCALVPFTT